MEEARATEGASADANTTQYRRFISNSNLSKLHAHAEKGCQVTKQLAEIDTPIGGELEEDEPAVQRDMRMDELHLQTMRLDAFPGLLVGCFCTLLVGLRFRSILFGNFSENQWGDGAFYMASLAVQTALSFELCHVYNGFTELSRDGCTVRVMLALDNHHVAILEPLFLIT